MNIFTPTVSEPLLQKSAAAVAVVLIVFAVTLVLTLIFTSKQLRKEKNHNDGRSAAADNGTVPSAYDTV